MYSFSIGLRPLSYININAAARFKSYLKVHLFCIQKGKKLYQVPEEILSSGTVKCFSSISWGLCCLQMLVSMCLCSCPAWFGIPFLHLLSTMLGSPSLSFSLSIGNIFPHGFCWFLYAISFLFFFFWFYALTLTWPANCNEFYLLWTWRLLAPWCFSTLSFLISLMSVSFLHILWL